MIQTPVTVTIHGLSALTIKLFSRHKFANALLTSRTADLIWW